MGRHTYNNTLKGSLHGALDDVKLFSCALSASEVQNIYLEGSTINIESLDYFVNSLEFFPNPSHGLIQMRNLDSKSLSIQIMNSIGQSVKHIMVRDQLLVDLSDLSPEIYHIQAKTQRGIIRRYRLVLTQ